MTVEKKAPQPQAVVLAEATIRIAQGAIKVTESGQFAFSRGDAADPQLAHMLVYDAKVQAYRAVLTPPGTSWELVEKKQGPGLWTPGRSS